MSWKQLHMAIVVGVCLGVFSAYGYFDLTFNQEKPFATEEPQSREVLSDLKKDASEIGESKETRENRTNQTNTAPEILPEKAAHSVPDAQIKDRTSPKSSELIPDSRTVPLSEIGHQNKTLANYNIMFFGIEDKKLQMLTVYSINKEHKWKSGTVFIPTDTLVPGTRNQSVAEFFYQNGAEEVKRLIGTAMEIEINYYVMVDRNLLQEVEPYLDPIYVNGERVNLAQLFTKEITPQDEIILASLLKNLTKPTVYFGVLPKLVWTCKQYIHTDFELNWPNLWVHYQIAKNIDTSSVTKKILPGTYVSVNEKKFWVPSQEGWWNTVYAVTN
ncbi:hypothetical protein [Candidatus Formimonas warabiya]|uniref:Uncharacterized protein n=1 Tax=Formimonas warabiya TaxID=1761012 RepID=A0A3G1KU70_FORW1|nr:hypothetical protein [Candidatus Formimonas warabiya]ATW25967.1 hypothetical protein DCMF_15340 [Candidatus Formimonas warabiya]